MADADDGYETCTSSLEFRALDSSGGEVVRPHRSPQGKGQNHARAFPLLTEIQYRVPTLKQTRSQL